MKKAVLILIAVGMMAFQQEDPPPEPPADTPACSNVNDQTSKNCTCPMAFPGDGCHECRPDRSLGQTWCKTYCLPGKCKCIKPMKTVMPWAQAHR